MILHGLQLSPFKFFGRLEEYVMWSPTVSGLSASNEHVMNPLHHPKKARRRVHLMEWLSAEWRSKRKIQEQQNYVVFAVSHLLITGQSLLLV